MQRHEMMAALTGLGLKGMAGAFDEAVTTGLQRKRTTMEILADLVRAETTHRHAASIRYRMAAAKLPTVKDLDAFVFDDTPINEGLVRSLHSGAFLANRRNIVLVGGTGTGKTHLATAIIANVVRTGARGRYFNKIGIISILFGRTAGIRRPPQEEQARRCHREAQGRRSGRHRARAHSPLLAAAFRRACQCGGTDRSRTARDWRYPSARQS